MRLLLSLLLGLALILCAPIVAASAAPPCVVGGAGGGPGILVSGVCAPVTHGSGDDNPDLGSSGPPTKTIICGHPSSNTNGFWDPTCGAQRLCPGGLAFATLVQQGGKWVLLDSWCPGDPAPAAPAAPVITGATLRQQVLRLLPKVQIGSAWATRALVNAESVLWAQTDAKRDLGAVTVVGVPVRLRIGFDHANWDFGDGVTDTTSDPGKPYSKADACASAQCAGYYGHTYRDVGAVTISLTVAWNAQFSLDGGATWTDVDPAALDGPATTHDLEVVQARGVLVPTP